MRIVGKFNDKDIRLDSFHMSKTYGGFLCGPSGKFVEEFNIRILKDSQGRECDRLFGKDNTSLIIGVENLNLKEMLPDVEAFARLSCLSPVRGKELSSGFSELIVIWFQEKTENPFDKLSELIKDVDWDVKAENIEWGDM